MIPWANDRELGFSNWALAQLIETATRIGMSETGAFGPDIFG